MLGYLSAKAAEYRILTELLRRSLADLPGIQLSHPALSLELERKITRLAAGYRRLDQIVAVEEPALAPFALATLHTMELDLLTLSYYYLPAAKSEGTEERRYSNLIFPAARWCGLAWIRDLLVQLQGGHATWLSIPEVPLVYAPLHQPGTLLDLAGVFHEFGHSVFERLEPVRDLLAQCTHEVFGDLRRGPGPVSPEQRAERDRTLREAERYWDARRLEEIFCDIFATYTCGPAYYFSCGDMAVRSGADPYALDLADVHPPLAARVESCARGLSPEHRRTLVSRRTGKVWGDYVKRYPQQGKFTQYCPPLLLQRLADETLAAIRTHLPEANRYKGPAPDAPSATDQPIDTSLADWLNFGVAILLTAPQEYPAWERQALARLLGQGT